MEGLLSSQNGEEQTKQKKRRKKSSATKIATTSNEKHNKLQAAVDAVDTWEKELESKHGLSESEAMACVSLVAEFHNHEASSESMPSAANQQFVDFAREGCRLMRELHTLMALHPQECGEQTKINGQWKMITGEPTLEEMQAERVRKASLRHRPNKKP